MNNYILCYRSEKGNRHYKTLLGEYLRAIDRLFIFKHQNIKF
ncbi:hypothetical protein [Spiroplasma kunkelii]|nr:hypothetical protein [Spiroplasma kunkelii]